MANTITIDPALYSDVENYAKEHNISITNLVENYFRRLTKSEEDSTAETSYGEYYISPKVSALHVGFKCNEDMPYDYKADLKEHKTDKYK